MSKPLVSSRPLPDFPLWERAKSGRRLLSFDLELTARCNFNCRHCYINLPAGDGTARARELSLEEIRSIAGEAVSLGALWCLITGGEPLLREDFEDVYLALKKQGLLVSIFTNAALITEKKARLFKAYPPRSMEVTVYGATEETHERVTRTPGSFRTFRRGVDRLLENGIRVRFKAMALRSNFGEIPLIASFCRERSREPFRFDPFLHLRFDGDPVRNDEIRSERLSPEEIVRLEHSDPERLGALERSCDQFIFPAGAREACDHLFDCGAGLDGVTLSHDGFLRLCPSLRHPECLYDLRRGTLGDAWERFVLSVRDRRSAKAPFLEKCRACPIINLCLWCPAVAHLETGEMDEPVAYFCDVARARAEALEKRSGEG